MSMELIRFPAFLAGTIVSRKNRPAPLSVFPRSAASARRGVLVLSHANISATPRAILNAKMPVLWLKGLSAIQAHKKLSRSISARVNASTTTRACDRFKVDPTLERFATDNTNPIMAIRAVVRAWIVDGKELTTSFAISLKCKGLFHRAIIPHFSQIQRWVDMTGGVPELIS